MTETAADARGFVYEPIRGPKRRVEYEPRSDGTYQRVESVWTGGTWQPVGREVVKSMRRI